MRGQAINKIIEYFENNDNLFIEAIEELDSWNGYLNDDRWFDMCALDELLYGRDLCDVLNMAYFGRDDDSWTTDASGNRNYNSFNPNRDYFSFNGCGNLVSSDFKDYSCYLDKWFIEELEKNRCHIYAIDDDINLSILFDELEEADGARGEE